MTKLQCDDCEQELQQEDISECDGLSICCWAQVNTIEDDERWRMDINPILEERRKALLRVTHLEQALKEVRALHFTGSVSCKCGVAEEASAIAYRGLKGVDKENPNDTKT